MSELHASDRLHSSPTVRALLWLGGVVALVLALIGVVVPGLPTTPFVLVAGACFVRASPRAHAWLLRNRLFGPMLREWEEHRSVPRRVKRISVAAMILMSGLSIWHFADRPWLQATILAAMAVGSVVVLRLPSRD
jgi:uncharacterized membrane protein YbaN (DUF454 family)